MPPSLKQENSRPQTFSGASLAKPAMPPAADLSQVPRESLQDAVPPPGRRFTAQASESRANPSLPAELGYGGGLPPPQASVVAARQQTRMSNEDDNMGDNPPMWMLHGVTAERPNTSEVGYRPPLAGAGGAVERGVAGGSQPAPARPSTLVMLPGATQDYLAAQGSPDSFNPLYGRDSVAVGGSGLPPRWQPGPVTEAVSCEGPNVGAPPLTPPAHLGCPRLSMQLAHPSTAAAQEQGARVGTEKTDPAVDPVRMSGSCAWEPQPSAAPPPSSHGRVAWQQAGSCGSGFYAPVEQSGGGCMGVPLSGGCTAFASPASYRQASGPAGPCSIPRRWPAGPVTEKALSRIQSVNGVRKSN